MFKLHTIGNIKIKLFMKREMLKTVMGRAIYMAFAVFAAFAMASCSDDDGNNGDGGDDTSGGGSDGTEMEAPRFESSAAKYTITDAGSPYTSVELTASGNYIIFTSGSQAPATAAAAPATRMSVMSDGAGRPGTRYIHYSNILSGKYTKTGEGEYELEGFGKLVVSGSGDQSYSLDITLSGGHSYSLKGNRAGTPSSGTMTDNLCRTWEIVQWRAFLRYNGVTMFDFTDPTIDGLNAKLEAWGREHDPDYTDGDYLLDFTSATGPEQVVFTKSGTYMVTYADSHLAVSTWRWGNQEKGMLEYSWDPNAFDPDGIYGVATAYFRKGNLELTEGFKETEDGFTIEQGTTYTLKEVK